MWTSKIAGLAAAGVLVMVGIAGCSAGGEQRDSTNAGSAISAAAPPQTGDSAGKAATGGKAAAALAPADVQRSIIYTGTVIVRVKDVDAAAAGASGLATTAAGYVSGDNRDIDSSRSIATMTLRVPSAKFYDTVTGLDALGAPQSRNVSTQDVTEQVIDVQSRLKTQQASVDRIRELLANTTSISQIVSLEDELTQRESDLESMEAQLRSLTDLTALSTITVTFLGPQARVAVVKKPHKTGFVAGLKSGWDGFVKSLTVLLTVLGAILPFAVAIGIPVAAIVWYLRRRRPAPAPMVAIAPPTGGMQPPA